MKQNKIICVIPARGGSKGLPNKNILPVAGHPLIAWPIAAAKKSSQIDKIIVSTDSEEIALIAKKYGAEVPFIRPAEVSGDLATTEETLQYSLIEAEKKYRTSFDIAVFLTATDFFRQGHWVDQVITALTNNDQLESSFIANKTHKNFWSLENEKPETYIRLKEWMRTYSNRQIRKPIYREDTGLACASRASLWREKRRIGDNVKIIPVDYSQCSIDIHDIFDLYLVETAYQWLKSNRPDQAPPEPSLI